MLRIWRETNFLSNLGGTAEIYLPSLYRDGRFFVFVKLGGESNVMNYTGIQNH